MRQLWALCGPKVPPSLAIVTLSTADGVTVNGAKVIQADVVTSNGVIHAIDAVILPPDVDVAALLAT
jgi:uncharacterized surface protein with fasciclin (FAS1) repeats